VAERIILASGSAQRKALLSTLGLTFEVIPANIDEKSIRYTDPRRQALELAKAKAIDIAASHKAAGSHQEIIIAADTFVVLGDAILEKPRNHEEALRMLESQSGQTVVVYTGLYYFDTTDRFEKGDVAKTSVTFRDLSAETIKRYCLKYPVASWAGAFSAMHDNGELIASVNGSLTGLNGLPIELLVPLLQRSGVVV